MPTGQAVPGRGQPGCLGLAPAERPLEGCAGEVGNVCSEGIAKNSSAIGERVSHQLQKHLRGGKGRDWGVRCSRYRSPSSFGAVGLMALKGGCRQPGRIQVALAHAASPMGSAPGQAHSALALAQNPHAHLPQHSHTPYPQTFSPRDKIQLHTLPTVPSSAPALQGCPGHGVLAILSVSGMMLMIPGCPSGRTGGGSS